MMSMCRSEEANRTKDPLTFPAIAKHHLAPPREAVWYVAEVSQGHRVQCLLTLVDSVRGVRDK